MTGETFTPIEQFMERYPEIAITVISEEVLRADPILVATRTHGQVGGKALWDDTEVARARRIGAIEGSAAGIVMRPAGAEPGDAGPREAEIGVTSMHGVGGIAIGEGEDDHRERPGSREVAQIRHCYGPYAIAV